MNTVLRVAEWVERWVFRLLDPVVRVGTAALARILRRGRFRSWRRGT
jgi:hypothetical protein